MTTAVIPVIIAPMMTHITGRMVFISDCDSSNYKNITINNHNPTSSGTLYFLSFCYAWSRPVLQSFRVKLVFFWLTSFFTVQVKTESVFSSLLIWSSCPEWGIELDPIHSKVILNLDEAEQNSVFDSVIMFSLQVTIGSCTASEGNMDNTGFEFTMWCGKYFFITILWVKSHGYKMQKCLKHTLTSKFVLFKMPMIFILKFLQMPVVLKTSHSCCTRV